MTPRTHERCSQRLLPNAQALAFVGALALLLLPSFPTAAISTGVDGARLIALTNIERGRERLPILRVDPLLSDAAQQRAEELARAGALAHVRPDGSLFSLAVSAAAYPYERIGENLAVDFFTNHAIVHAWLASPSHRRNLLSAHYRDIGIGVVHAAVDGKPTMFVVQLLGRARNITQLGWHEMTAALPLG